jgi:hypothetical protein
MRSHDRGCLGCLLHYPLDGRRSPLGAGASTSATHVTLRFSALSLPLFGTMSNVTLSPSRRSFIFHHSLSVSEQTTRLRFASTAPIRKSIVMECLARRSYAIPPKAGADREAADVQKVPSKAEVSQPLFFAALACNRTESETTTSNAGLPYSVRQPELSEIFCHTVQDGGGKDHCLFEF